MAAVFNDPLAYCSIRIEERHINVKSVHTPRSKSQEAGLDIEWKHFKIDLTRTVKCIWNNPVHFSRVLDCGKDIILCFHL